MNKLEHLDEFQELLANYQISASTETQLSTARLAVLLAPTAGGRNTIMRELLKTGRYHYIISDTTREKRINDGVLERDGVEYWFKTEEEVLTGIREGRYIEAEIIHGQQVSGTNSSELEVAESQQQVAITDVDLAGAQNVAQLKPDAFVILVLPPSFAEWQRRLKLRGAMESGEYRRRLESAMIIFGLPFRHDYFQLVINDKVDHAAAQIEAIIQGKPDKQLRELALELCKQLRAETAKFLQTI